MKTVGLLIAARDTDEVWHSYITAFEHAVNTKPVPNYDPQPQGGAGGDPKLYDTAAEQLVTDKVDVIVTAGELAAEACKKATNANKPTKPIPVVVASAGDLSKFAGSNVTGFTNGQVNTQISDERIKIMNNRWNPVFVMVAGNDDVAPVKTAMDYVLGKLGNNKGHKISLKNKTDLANLQATLASQKKPNGINVLYVCSDPFVRTNGTAIVQAAHALGMKTMHEFGDWHVKHKGDLCFGPDFKKLFQKAASYVDQILADDKIATLPVVEAQIADCVQTPS